MRLVKDGEPVLCTYVRRLQHGRPATILHDITFDQASATC